MFLNSCLDDIINFKSGEWDNKKNTFHNFVGKKIVEMSFKQNFSQDVIPACYNEMLNHNQLKIKKLRF